MLHAKRAAEDAVERMSVCHRKEVTGARLPPAHDRREVQSTGECAHFFPPFLKFGETSAGFGSPWSTRRIAFTKKA